MNDVMNNVNATLPANTAKLTQDSVERTGELCSVLENNSFSRTERTIGRLVILQPLFVLQVLR